MKTLSLCTGGFDPIHPGHINYLKEAAKLADILIVGLNSDEWLRRKKGRPFMSWSDRCTIIESLYFVDRVVHYDDADNTGKEAIRIVREMYPEHHIFFCNGGDRTELNTPERDYQDGNIEFVFGVGGDKTHSSSELTRNIERVEKPWGWYEVLHEEPNFYKIKKIVVKEGHRTSFQYHKLHSELIVDYLKPIIQFIPKWVSHRLDAGQYIEIQLGRCDEGDIIRLDDDYGRA